MNRYIQLDWQFTETLLDRDLNLLKTDIMLLSGEFSLKMKPLTLDRGKFSKMGRKILSRTLVDKMSHRIWVHIRGCQTLELDLGPK